MMSRGTVIAALIAMELAVVGEGVVAVRAGLPPPSARAADMRVVSGTRLSEDGPHQIFDAAASPALTVDIGYADLTIVASASSQIDVSLSGSSMFGMFGSNSPIVTQKDGDTIRIATSGTNHRMSMGDDRMVTVVLPANTRITVVNAGDIKANGLRAEASLNSVGSGTITVNDYDAPALHVETSDGLISLHRVVAPRLDATSNDDRIEGTDLQVRNGDIESDDRITLGFATGTDTVVSAGSNDGKVRISGFTGAESTKSSSNGDSDDDSSHQTVRIGAGDGHLNVHSNDGNIDIAQDG